MITGKVKKRVDVPHEQGEWFEFKLLSGKQETQARERKTLRAMESIRALGGDVFHELRNAETAPDDETTEADPLDAYDVDVLLHHGIAGWSYHEKLSTANIDLLDRQTREWAAREIATMLIETEAARKND